MIIQLKEKYIDVNQILFLNNDQLAIGELLLEISVDEQEILKKYMNKFDHFYTINSKIVINFNRLTMAYVDKSTKQYRLHIGQYALLIEMFPRMFKLLIDKWSEKTFRKKWT